jgi:hypothetical protein
MLPLPLKLSTPRTWLRPAGAGPGEIACSLVVDGHVRWLRARLRGRRVEFTEISPTTNPTKWQPAQPAAVSQAERALRYQIDNRQKTRLKARWGTLTRSDLRGLNFSRN